MKPRAATFATFMVNGAIVGTWVAYIPWMQQKLGVSKGTLGLSLLCMALGSLLAMPLAGQILDRRPSGGGVRPARGAVRLPVAARAAAGPHAGRAGGAAARARRGQRLDGRRHERPWRGG